MSGAKKSGALELVDKKSMFIVHPAMLQVLICFSFKKRKFKAFLPSFTFFWAIPCTSLSRNQSCRMDGQIDDERQGPLARRQPTNLPWQTYQCPRWSVWVAVQCIYPLLRPTKNEKNISFQKKQIAECDLSIRWNRRRREAKHFFPVGLVLVCYHWAQIFCWSGPKEPQFAIGPVDHLAGIIRKLIPQKAKAINAISSKTGQYHTWKK